MKLSQALGMVILLMGFAGLTLTDSWAPPRPILQSSANGEYLVRFDPHAQPTTGSKASYQPYAYWFKWDPISKS